ncbi:MAG: sulfotransferase family 2 domain-containing protein [Halioglobus sp.]
MIINHDHKLIFVHIPKTGGEFLRSLIPNQEDLPKHARAVDGREILGARLWNEYTTISIVRNPYDLVVSMYEHLRKPLKMPVRTYRKYGSLILRPRRACKTAMLFPFKRYVEKVFLENQVQEEYSRKPPVRHFDQQSTWIYDCENCLVDRIYHFESIGSFLTDYASIFPEYLDTRKRVNASTRKSSFQDYYDEPTREIILNRYLEDFSHFGYEKSL